MFDGTFFSMLVLLGVLVAIAWFRGGSEFVLDGLGSGGSMLQRFAALFVVAFLVAGLAEKLIPHDWISNALGAAAAGGARDAGGAPLSVVARCFISFVASQTSTASLRESAAVFNERSLFRWRVLGFDRAHSFARTGS